MLVGGIPGIVHDPATGALQVGADPRRDGYAIGLRSTLDWFPVKELLRLFWPKRCFGSPCRDGSAVQVCARG